MRRARTRGAYEASSSPRNDTVKSVFPRRDRRAHLVHIAVTLIHANDAAETSRDVVEELLRHFEADAQCGEISCEGPPQVMKRPRRDLAVLVEGRLEIRPSGDWQ